MLPVITAQGLLLFVGENVAKAGASWVGSSAMTAITGGASLNDVVKDLQEIRASLTRIEGTLKQMMQEIAWQHQVTRAHDAEEGIKHKFTRLLDIALLEEDDAEKLRQVDELKRATLSVNGGALAHLDTIHNVLMGKSVTDPSQRGLLRLWAERSYDQLKARDGTLSLNRYAEVLEAYLANVFLLQIVGFTSYLNAMSNERTRKQQITKLKERMEEQKAEFYKYIPTTTHKILTLMDQYFVFYVPGTRRVIYGSPTDSRGTVGGGSTQLRDRLPRNGDEEWKFLRSPTYATTGTYVLVKRAYDDKNKFRRGGHLGFSSPHDGGASCMAKFANATPLKIIPNFTPDDSLSVTIYSKDSNTYLGRGQWYATPTREPAEWKLEAAGT